MPYREPRLRPPDQPTWNVERVALVFEAVLDRAAVVFDRVASRYDERSPLHVRLLFFLLAGVVMGVLAGGLVLIVQGGGD